MQRVITDRTIDPPMRIDDIPAMEQHGAWCMEQYRVRHLTSLLSLDGRRLVCVFDAPDAEAVRNTHRQLGEPFGKVWACTLHAPQGMGVDSPLGATGARLVCVDRTFTEPVVFADIAAIEERGAWCLEQHRVHFLRTAFASDRRRMICIYSAPDAEAVRLAQAQAQMPFDNVWSVQLYESKG